MAHHEKPTQMQGEPWTDHELGTQRGLIEDELADPIREPSVFDAADVLQLIVEVQEHRKRAQEVRGLAEALVAGVAAKLGLAGQFRLSSTGSDDDGRQTAGWFNFNWSRYKEGGAQVLVRFRNP